MRIVCDVGYGGVNCRRVTDTGARDLSCHIIGRNNHVPAGHPTL